MHKYECVAHGAIGSRDRIQLRRDITCLPSGEVTLQPGSLAFDGQGLHSRDLVDDIWTEANTKLSM